MANFLRDVIDQQPKPNLQSVYILGALNKTYFR